MGTLGSTNSFVLVQCGDRLLALCADWIRPISLASNKPEDALPEKILLEDGVTVDLIELNEDRFNDLYHGPAASGERGVQVVGSMGGGEAAQAVGKMLEAFEDGAAEATGVAADGDVGGADLSTTVNALQTSLASAQGEIANLRHALRDQLGQVLKTLKGEE